MQDHIAEIGQQPAILRLALHPGLKPMLLSHPIDDRIRQGLEHPVARPGANHEIICKIRKLADIHQNDIFPFFILEHVNNRTRNFQSVQMSPHRKMQALDISPGAHVYDLRNGAA